MRARIPPTLAVSILVAGTTVPGLAAVRLPSLFRDHMVLQQSSAAPVWGWARPGEQITIHGDWGPASATTTADEQGRFRVALATAVAGGPYTLTVRGDETLTIADVMLGEVWICSGQSNMEKYVGPQPGQAPIDRSADEVAAANHPEIRLFTVARAMADAPRTDCTGEWTRCSPQTIPAFSAVAYFFGRKLHEVLGVPIGLIHTSWGGTEVELWMSEPALREVPELAATMARREELMRDFARADAEWRQRYDAADPGTGRFSAADLDEALFAALPAPTTFERMGLAAFDGTVWFRGTIEVPASFLGQATTLELGPIDDDDTTWVNGTEVGRTRGPETARRYELKPGLLHAGRNTIAVRVDDSGGPGGFSAAPDAIAIRCGAESARFSSWRWHLGADRQKLAPAPRPTWRSQAVLYNGMIAPLIPYAMRGAIWYQGESNVERAHQYRLSFPAMIASWRRDWGTAFPFYFVQIAPFSGYRGGRSAELREAQLFTLRSTPATGMVVTTDITADVRDIHPTDKQDVGERLALWALARTYEEDLACSGPLYRSMAVEGGRIRVTFDEVGEGLVARGGPLTHFTIAGADRRFVPADAAIDGATIVVSSPDVANPVAVRFAWSDAPLPNLFNQAGLPASPFRTDDWPCATDAERW